MRLDVIRPVLLAAVVAVSGLTANHVYWDKQPEGYTPTAPRMSIRLGLLPSSSVGMADATSYVVVQEPTAAIPFGTARSGAGRFGGPMATRTTVAERLDGLRRVTWTIHCESLEPGDSTTAQGYLEKVRTRLRSETARALLATVGVTITSDTDITDVPYTNDHRATSTATTDMICSVLYQTPGYPEYEGAIDYIDSAEVIEG